MTFKDFKYIVELGQKGDVFHYNYDVEEPNSDEFINVPAGVTIMVHKPLPVHKCELPLSESIEWWSK
jgi:hypothetical protein